MSSSTYISNLIISFLLELVLPLVEVGADSWLGMMLYIDVSDFGILKIELASFDIPAGACCRRISIDREVFKAWPSDFIDWCE